MLLNFKLTYVIKVNKIEGSKMKIGVLSLYKAEFENVFNSTGLNEEENSKFMTSMKR